MIKLVRDIWIIINAIINGIIFIIVLSLVLASIPFIIIFFIPYVILGLIVAFLGWLIYDVIIDFPKSPKVEEPIHPMDALAIAIAKAGERRKEQLERMTPARRREEEEKREMRRRRRRR